MVSDTDLPGFSGFACNINLFRKGFYTLMKKLFLAGALCAAMALSSTAFAAVEEDSSLNVSYDDVENTVSVTDNLSSYEGQMTVLILNADTSEIVAENIIYIDQTAAAEGIFQNMGVLLPEGADKLPAGTYYVKVGGENVPNILVGEFTVSDGGEGQDITFVFGDVNGSYTGDGAAAASVDAADASNILALVAGGTTNRGGAYNIGDIVTDKEGKTFVFGDVNGSYTGDGAAAASVDAADASNILALVAGGTTNRGGAYNIGDIVTVTVPAE